MIRNGEASLDAAAARLTAAIDTLEARLQTLRDAPPPVAAPDTGEMEALQAELRERRMRERALEGAAAEASTVLGRAAEQIRAALEDDEEEEDEPEAASPAQQSSAADLDDLSDDQTDMHPAASREF